jgi:hypothetical protein
MLELLKPAIDPSLLIDGIDDQEVRKELAKQFKYFCLIYLPHYFELAPADFFEELIANLEDDDIDALEIIGFRGSAKSTFVGTAYILYSALVKPELYPFIFILRLDRRPSERGYCEREARVRGERAPEARLWGADVRDGARACPGRYGISSRAGTNGRRATCCSPPASASWRAAAASAFAVSATARTASSS